MAGRNPQTAAAGDSIDNLKRRAQPLPRSPDQRILHRSEVKGDRRNARCRARRLGNRGLRRPGWTDEYDSVGFPILHPAQHRAGHLRFDAREVRARSGEGLFDLVHENHYTRSFLTSEHRSQKPLDVLAAANICERFTAAPDAEPRSLFDHLPLSLPKLFRIEATLRERHRKRLLSRKCRETKKRIDCSSPYIGCWFIDLQIGRASCRERV